MKIWKTTIFFILQPKAGPKVGPTNPQMCYCYQVLPWVLNIEMFDYLFTILTTFLEQNIRKSNENNSFCFFYDVGPNYAQVLPLTFFPL